MIEQIFRNEPEDWGLRGDPYFWRDLGKYMAAAKEPTDVAEFEKLFFEAYRALIGEPLIPGKKIFIEKYSFGGMSSGHIDSSFWLRRGLPILRERFVKMNQ